MERRPAAFDRTDNSGTHTFSLYIGDAEPKAY
jgi:hypothetical protein